MKFTKKPRERGLAPITKSIQEFPTGARVTIVIDPRVHKRQPHHRYQGRVGIIYGKMGRGYMVEIKDGGKIKKIVAGPEHLELVK